MLQHPAMKREVGDHAVDAVLIQGAPHTANRFVARAAPGDQLGDERVVMHGDLEAAVDTAVVANADAAGRLQEGDLSRAMERSCCTDLRRRRGTRLRVRGGPVWSCRKGSGLPAATSICVFTRSTPVIISVIGCST